MIKEFDNDIIACLPLDTGIFNFNRSLINELIKYDTLLQSGDSRSSYVWGRKEIIFHAYGSTIDDFYNVTTTTNSWYDRYIMKDIKNYNINPSFSLMLKKETQRLLDFIYNNIPIFPAHVTLVNSTSDTPVHCDVPPEQVKYFYNKGLEPANVKMILNLEDYDNTLYFERYGTKNNPERQFLEKEKHIPPDTNFFGWSENFHGHGGIIKKGTNRLLVNIFGPLDKSAYKQLLERSWIKYKKYAITFEMDCNDSYTWKK